MNKELKYLRFILIAIIIGFTILFGSSMFWNIKKEFLIAHEYSVIESKASFNKDILYRRWVAMHGGVYVPVTDTTTPNPNLKHIAGRDITTPSGKKLTLINPAYMTRQVFEMAQEQYGVKGHITSLDPIRPANKADEWESEALKIFEKGEEEYHSTDKINNIEYLRYMHVMKVEKSCLKCHAQQGYKIGDIRGGISVSVPIDKYESIAASKIRFSGITHVIIYLIFIYLSLWAYFKFFKEFTKRNQIQQKLIKGEEFYRLINNTTFDQIYSYDLENRFTSANKTLCENLKLSEDDIIGKTYWELGFPEENCSAWDEWHRKTYENGMHTQISETAMPDGTTQYFEVNLFVLKDSKGTAIGLAGVNRNITQSKIAEQEIIKAKEKAEESETKFKAAFYTSPDAGSMSTLNGEYVEINEGFTRISGYTETEVLGKTSSDINLWAVPEDRNKFVAALRENDYIENFESAFRTKDGTIIPALVSARIIMHKNEPFILGVTRNITERKKYETELLIAKEKAELSEKKYRELFTNMTNGFALHKVITNEKGEPVDYIITEVNPAYEEMIGVKAEHVLNKRIKELFSAIDDEWIKKTGNVALTGVPDYHEMYSDLNNRHFAISLTSSEKGYFNSFLNDITELKQNEIELINAKERAEESEERFTLAMNAAKDGLYDWDLVTNEIYYSPGWKRMLGYNDKELPNDLSVWEKLTEPKDVQKSWEMQQQLINKQRERFEMEFKMKHKDGHWVDILSRADVVFNEDGKAIRMVGTHIDISERKRAQEKIQIAEENLKNTFNLSPSIIAKVNLNTGYFLEASPAVTRMLGYTIKKFTKKPMWEFIHPDDTKETDVVVADHINGNDTTYFENRYLCKDGSYKWMAWHGRHGDKDGIVTTIGSDITERKQAEIELIKAKEKAEESDQLKTEFIHNMSHEIRTPMNGILGFSTLLDKPNISEEKRKNFIDIIQNSGSQLMRIIDDILEISKLGTKQVKILENEVCLNSVLLEQFSIFDIKAKENKIPLYFKKGLSDIESTILIDDTKLNKIVSNLLENALKFTSTGFIELGYHLKTDTEPFEVEIYVKDTGIGIKPESQEIIFERFSQEEKELSRNVGGLGLGLSIAKDNAELLGGKITLQSEKGKGSTFFVTIPYKPVNSIIEKSNSNKIIDNETEEPDKYTILIVEDEEVNYLYLETLLVDEIEINCNILHAKHGKEAVDICNENAEIDFILMDLKMPIMNGFEATKLIKEFRLDLPIVAQTAYTTEEDKEKALSAGCNDFISKPISVETLKEIMNKYLIMKH
ncbi:MAG: PAS domain S-box protein [Salinivirgaceae bacterium]|nr:PAS domain S-box protein [Salinivirgaceae bacterium]